MNKDEKFALDLSVCVADAGGRAYYVGGYVRDKLVGKENKDIDIEIHGISREILKQILKRFGEINENGSGYGVYGVEGYDVDVALPRREKTIGRGHKDVVVEVDPFMGSKEAAVRRDFTVNALMQDVLSLEIVDHYGGVSDLENQILRHVAGDTFASDPLRLLRGAQFAARFEFELAPETMDLCRTMDLTALKKERVLEEVEKAMMKAIHPSVFFENLREMGQLKDWFSELEELIGIPQNPIYHPEGDVWNHTMGVLDAAASLRDQAEEKSGFMFSALFHDLGKIVTTKEIDGVVHSYGHESKGLPLVKRALTRLTTESKMVKYVLNMTSLHMKPTMMLNQHAKKKSFNKVFDQAMVPHDLILLCRADHSGKGYSQKKIQEEIGNPEEDKKIWEVMHNPEEDKNGAQWVQDQLEEKLESYEAWMSQPYIEGKDLIQAGLKPGKEFSDILAYAHKLRLAEVPKDAALVQTLAYARKMSKTGGV